MSDYTIAIDAMGGDYGPAVTLKATLTILRQHPRLRLILVGDETVLKRELGLLGTPEHSRLTLCHASQVVTMEDAPSFALRNKKDSSLRVTINLVKEGKAQACVSAGNTGALLATARFVLKTLPGIDRPAISSTLPTMDPNIRVRMLDLGGNVDSSAENLVQFAVMGSVLSSAVDNIPNPRVVLLNIGSEEIKGNEQVKRAGQLLSQTSEINYCGYIEGDDIYKGVADVVVCDGFVGNVALKVTEGVAKMVAYYIKKAFNQNYFTRLSKLAAGYALKDLRKQLNPDYYNGASFVGLQGIVLKSHGGANVLAFTNAIEEAISEIEKNIPERICARVTEILKNMAQHS